MDYPNFLEERKAYKKGYKIVVGVDEAGRGPLAGPVFAAAVWIKEIKKFQNQFKEIKDSKKLSSRRRHYFYNQMISLKYIEWGIGRVSEKIIDKSNILEATKLAMLRAVKALKGKLFRNGETSKPDFLIIDGTFFIKTNLDQKAIIKADSKVYSCVAAGIIAKEERDRFMRKLHLKYPYYGFDKNKGYPTKKHFLAIKKFGLSPVHRKTFAVSKIFNLNNKNKIFVL